MVEQQQGDSIIALLSEFSTKLRDLEERQRMIKERVMMIGKNFVEEKEKSDYEILEIKKSLESINQDIDSIKRFLKRVSEEIDNFVRKEDFDILNKQARIFQPIKFARIEDVERIIKETLERKSEKGKSIKTAKNSEEI
jgi:seryl-tRNA synthetase